MEKTQATEQQQLDQTSSSNTEDTQTATEAIAETIDFYKQKYEEEKALREKSDKEVINLTKMLRNATIQPLSDEKPKSSEQLLNELFGEGGEDA